MQVQEFLQALDQIAQVYRSRNGTKPADALLKVRAQLTGFENLTISDWVALKSREVPQEEPQLRINSSEELQAILAELEQAADMSSTEATFQKLEALTLTADSWITLAKLATGRRSKSGKEAKAALRSYLANQVQLHNRRASISRLFS